MFDFLKNMMTGSKAPDLGALIADGATVLDVRTPQEYASGHITGSVNIPLQTLQGKLSSLKKDKAIITCCASGMRSASAKSLLLQQGFAEVHNAGSWVALKKYEK